MQLLWIGAVCALFAHNVAAVSLQSPLADNRFHYKVREVLTPSPVIGIVTTPYCISDDPKKAGFQPGCENSTVSAFQNSYVKWLEQGGAKIMPIRYDLPLADIDRLFDSVNGVLFTGGSLSLEEDTLYYATVKHIMERAAQAYAAGDYFPLWGTCMGMQIMTIITAGDWSALERFAFDSERVLWPLHYTKAALGSRMLAAAPHDVIMTLANEPVTLNAHHDGITPESWAKHPTLDRLYRVVSTNWDKKGKPFISTIEGWELPFYATQWHPEPIQFSMGPASEELMAPARTPQGIRANQHFANFFVDECRRNGHRFASKDEEMGSLLYNYTPENKGNGSAVYVFHRNVDDRTQ